MTPPRVLRNEKEDEAYLSPHPLVELFFFVLLLGRTPFVSKGKKRVTASNFLPDYASFPNVSVMDILHFNPVNSFRKRRCRECCQMQVRCLKCLDGMLNWLT